MTVLFPSPLLEFMARVETLLLEYDLLELCTFARWVSFACMDPPMGRPSRTDTRRKPRQRAAAVCIMPPRSWQTHTSGISNDLAMVCTSQQTK